MRILEAAARGARPPGAEQEILREVWGPGRGPRAIWVYLGGLRHQLEPDHRPRHLITEPGIGYRYQP
ncbi:winged helix-turn-helix domain-containing protein [Kitasatospora arboriphila]